ncbi:MAG TPA: metallophosphoesterase [Fimbriimonadaceae bacterium]|nr:metallophosphoesterase [Fimbriimonadaceae bacterium]
MKLRDWAFLVGGASAGLLAYGALYESRRLVIERRTLALPRWPDYLSGFTLALLGDFHLRDRYSMELAQRAVAVALDADPDMVVLIGDFVGYWKPDSARMLGELLEPMLMMNGNAVAVPGNHEYWRGSPDLLAPILDELNVKFLRNQNWKHQGINWIGIDSANMRRHRPLQAIENMPDGPSIVLWHEPDPIDQLPFRANLMLSGHTHGGQWKFPGWTPIHTRNGVKYEQGFFPRPGRTPLYVTRGVGTTGPPARFLCPPEVSLLTLVPGEQAHIVRQSTDPA